MLARLQQTDKKKGHVLQMHHVFKAYASDVITKYAFGDCFHFLDQDDWGKGYFSSTDKYFSLTHVFGHFPIVMQLVNNMPTWVLALFIPNLAEMSGKQEVSILSLSSLCKWVNCEGNLYILAKTIVNRILIRTWIMYNSGG